MLYNIIMTDYNGGVHEPDVIIIGTVDVSYKTTGLGIKIDDIVKKIERGYNPKNSSYIQIVAEKVKVLDKWEDLIPPYVACYCNVYNKKYSNSHQYKVYTYARKVFLEPRITLYNQKEQEESRWGDISVTMPREDYDKITDIDLRKLFERYVPEDYTL